MIVFPLSYILGDVLTEVYGYARAREVIWLGFLCNLVAVVAIVVAGAIASDRWRSGGRKSRPEHDSEERFPRPCRDPGERGT